MEYQLINQGKSTLSLSLLSLLSNILVLHKVATSKGRFSSDLLLVKERLSLAGMCMGHGCIKCIKSKVLSPEG